MNQDLNYNIGEWVDNGNEINSTLRARLKNEAMGIDFSNDFDNTYYIAYNNIPRPELKQAYENLRKARNQFHRDEQETLSEYVAQGEILFVDADNEQYYDEIKALVGKRIKCPPRMLPNTEAVPQQDKEVKPETAHNAETNNVDEEKRRRKEERERKKREAERNAEHEKLNEQKYQEEAKRKQEQRRKSNQSKENRRSRKKAANKLWKILFTVGILLFLLIESDLVWSLKSKLKSRGGDNIEEVETVIEEDTKEKTTNVKGKKKEKKQSEETIQEEVREENAIEEDERESHQSTEEVLGSSQVTITTDNQSELNGILKELHKQFAKDNGKSRFETNVEYGIEKGINDVSDLLKRAETLNPQNKEVISYRKQYNSIMKEHDLL